MTKNSVNQRSPREMVEDVISWGKSGGFPAVLFEKTKPICQPSAGNPKH